MKKQKLLNTPFKSPYLNYFRVRYFAFLFLFSGIALPSFSQNLNPCSAIQVIGTSENDAPNNDGAVFQGILVRNDVTPNQAIRIYNENWELLDECISSECGNSYTFATGTGKYFVQVSLFDDNDGWICQSDPFEVSVAAIDINCPDVENGGICPGTIRLTTQAEIDAFCPCEVIEGDIIIGQEGENDITSLANLKSLKAVTGFLAVFNTQLANL